jgi:periplasmic protein CpxP/Spy
MLKHWLIALTLAGFACTVTASAIAQDNSSNQPAQSGEQSEHGHRHFDPAKRTEMLTKELKLNSDQQAKVLDIFKSEQSQMESLHSDSSMSQDDRRTKMMDIHKSSNDQVRALLDADQQKKFDEMQTRHDHWQGHGQGAAPDSPQN